MGGRLERVQGKSRRKVQGGCRVGWAVKVQGKQSAGWVEVDLVEKKAARESAG